MTDHTPKRWHLVCIGVGLILGALVGLTATARAQPTAAPTFVDTSEPVAGSLRVEWSQVAGATGYHMRHNTRSDFRVSRGAQQIDTTAGIRSFTITGLDVGRTYYLWVRAVDADGNGPWSAVASVLLVGPPPTVVRNLAVTPAGRVTWTAPATPGVLTGYTVVVTADALADPDDLTGTTVAASATGATVSLAPATENYVWVRATNGGGNSPWTLATATVAASPGDGVVTDVAEADPAGVRDRVIDIAIEWTGTVIILFAAIAIFGFALVLLAVAFRRGLAYLAGLVAGRESPPAGWHPDDDLPDARGEEHWTDSPRAARRARIAELQPAADRRRAARIERLMGWPKS